MGLEFEIEARPSYLHVVCSGDFEIEGVKEMFGAVFDAVEKYRIRRVYVDALSLGGSASAAERYGVGAFISEQMVEHGQGSGVRIGFVVDGGKFDETVASNRGCTVRAGTDRKKVLEWLGIDPAGRPDVGGDE